MEQTIKILKDQIAELEALICLKDRRIKELELLVAPKSVPSFSQYPQIPTPWAPANPPLFGCLHEFPTMWGSTHPPRCMKCGYQSGVSFKVTSSLPAENGGAGGTTNQSINIRDLNPQNVQAIKPRS